MSADSWSDFVHCAYSGLTNTKACMDSLSGIICSASILRAMRLYHVGYMDLSMGQIADGYTNLISDQQFTR